MIHYHTANLKQKIHNISFCLHFWLILFCCQKGNSGSNIGSEMICLHTLGTYTSFPFDPVHLKD